MQRSAKIILTIFLASTLIMPFAVAEETIEMKSPKEVILGDKIELKLVLKNYKIDSEVNVHFLLKNKENEIILKESKIISIKNEKEIVISENKNNTKWEKVGKYNLTITINGKIYIEEIEVVEIPKESNLVYIVPIASAVAILFVIYLVWYVMKHEEGTYEMKEVANAIKEGANAFLNRQYKTITILAILFAVFLTIAYGLGVKDWKRAGMTATAFLLGAGCSGIAGYIGMYVSVRSNIRCANAARTSLNKAIIIALRGGAVSGILVVAMSLLGVAGLYYAYNYGTDPRETPFLIVGYGFGASFVALFAQLGGGIYTKAADVGSDIVGKAEAGIPEDDPRNAAVIADLVGDNVGDCAGRGADLFESTAAENIGAMILGVALFPVFGVNGIMFPLVARAFGLFATIVGLLVVHTKENNLEKADPMKALNLGYFITCILAAIFFAIAAWQMLVPTPEYLANHPNLKANVWVYYFLCGLVGIITSILFVYITQYYTESKYRPVKEIANASTTGSATNIISGISVGLECTALPVITISSALLISYQLGEWSGITHGGLYGTAIATMGMLATCAYILAMDTFGPITDNAGGITEMSRKVETEKKVKTMEEIEMERKAGIITAKLDAVGNTTKALTKGYAIGSAALAAFLLFSAYLDEVEKLTGEVFKSVDIAKIGVFVGGLLGAMIVFLFSGWAIRAVGRASSDIIKEVKRQFKENPEIMEWKVKPDYSKAVDICTKAALREMVVPGLVAVLSPIVVGITFRVIYGPGGGAEPVAALLMVGTIGGILLATMMNNSGGAWDNAKKYIEGGVYGGKKLPNGEKNPTHVASVVGDTVGDPLKDTAGPSIHVLIKLLSTITLVMAVLFI